MAKYDDEQNIREIESRLDIVELISETVHLSRKGKNYWGLCPFHQEKTASFSVNREKQMFYCFGCHAGGNIFSYVMKKEGLEFREALGLLAAKAGVEIYSAWDRKVVDRRKAIVTVNNAAARFYHEILLSKSGQEAQDYLTRRGVKRETIILFKLGYAHDEWNRLEEYLLKKGFSAEIVKLSGLIKRSENNKRFFDLFRHRLIFPIFQYKDDVVGFGGRSLGDVQPKYLNTAETELFSKRKNLYGLSLARDSIREANSAILVEGYMDCIKLQQAGVKNVVASLGTALTEEQARLLRRYTEKVIVIYDGDESGQRETMRAIAVLQGEDLKAEVVTLPVGKDPDDFIDYYGKEEFYHYVKNNGCSAIEYKINRHISKAQILDLEIKIQIINLLKEDIEGLPSALERDTYIKMLARKLRVEENVVRQEFVNSRLKYRSDASKRNNIAIIRDNNKYVKYGIQEKILAAMLKNGAIFEKVKSRIGINFFADPEYRAIAANYDQLQGDKTDKMSSIMHSAPSEEIESAYARIAMLIDEDNPDEAREVEEFIQRVEQKRTDYQWQKTMGKLQMLKETGNFNSVLAFVLDIDKNTNLTRERGLL